MAFCAQCGDVVDAERIDEVHLTVKADASYNRVNSRSGSFGYTRTTLRPATTTITTHQCAECGAPDGVLFMGASSAREALALEAEAAREAYEKVTLWTVWVLGAIGTGVGLFMAELNLAGWFKLGAWLAALGLPGVAAYAASRGGGRAFGPGLHSVVATSVVGTIAIVLVPFVCAMAAWFLSQLVDPDTEYVAFAVGGGIGAVGTLVWYGWRLRGISSVRRRLRKLAENPDGIFSRSPVAGADGLFEYYSPKGRQFPSGALSTRRALDQSWWQRKDRVASYERALTEADLENKKFRPLLPLSPHDPHVLEDARWSFASDIRSEMIAEGTYARDFRSGHGLTVSTGENGDWVVELSPPEGESLRLVVVEIEEALEQLWDKLPEEARRKALRQILPVF